MKPTLDPTHVADLARLTLTEEEKAIFAADMEKIVAFCDGIAAIPTPPPSLSDAPLGVTREDEPDGTFCREWLLSSAPSTHEGYVTVPRTVGEEEA